MKRLLVFLTLAAFAVMPRAAAQGAQPVSACGAPLPHAPVLVGMTDTAAYFPKLKGLRVAVLANHTAVARFCEPAQGKYAAEAERLPGVSAGEAAALLDRAGSRPARLPGASADGTIHLVDLLHGRGFNVTGIFSPEHGFRGTADAGEHVGNSVDGRTGIPIRSLYDGNTKRPSDEAMQSFDVLVVDMQDVGLRFYTYYITMLRMMDACAEFGRTVVVLDRPNPNGHLIDGPVLDMKYKSASEPCRFPCCTGLRWARSPEWPSARGGAGNAGWMWSAAAITPMRHLTGFRSRRRPICRRSVPSTSIRRSAFSKGRSSVLGAEPTSRSKSTAIPI